jgi:hypothetical protein
MYRISEAPARQRGKFGSTRQGKTYDNYHHASMIKCDGINIESRYGVSEGNPVEKKLPNGPLTIQTQFL